LLHHNQKFIKTLKEYHYLIVSKKGEIEQASKEKEGNYLVTKTDDFVALSGKNRYNANYNVHVMWGEHSGEGKELSVTIDENGTLSVYVDHIAEKDIDRGISGGITKAGTKLLTQFELNKGDNGFEYDVWEDEVMDSPKDFYRPDPPKKRG